MSAVDQLVLYERKMTWPFGNYVLITAKSITSHSKVIRMSSVKRLYWEKYNCYGPRVYCLYCEYSVGFFLWSWVGLYFAKSIDDGMNFSEEDQKEIDKIYRVIDIARLS